MAAAGDLQIQVSALQKQIKILKNDKHQARLSCLDLLGASIDNLETVQEIQAKIRSLQEEKEQLQNRLEVQQQQFEAREQETIVDLAKWAAEQEKHLLLHEAFEKGNDSLVTLEAKYQSLLEENTRLKIEIEKKDCIITNLQGQITGLQATVTANSKDINDLKFQVTQLTQLIQTVKIDNQR
jgi:chromosome segregation ATPase